MRKYHNKNSRGFTLVELLVVVAIIAILAAIALPQFSRYRQSAFRNAVRSDIRNAVSAVEAFAADFGGYPTGFDGGPSCGPGPASCGLTDGANTVANVVNVSRNVTLTFTAQNCATGEAGYRIDGVHSQLGAWTASYDSCTGQYQNF